MKQLKLCKAHWQHFLDTHRQYENLCVRFMLFLRLCKVGQDCDICKDVFDDEVLEDPKYSKLNSR